MGTAIVFPRKMEYGEVISECYQLVPGSIQAFKKLLTQDADVTLTAYITTTLGEVYKSDLFPVRKIVKLEQYVR